MSVEELDAATAVEETEVGAGAEAFPPLAELVGIPEGSFPLALVVAGVEEGEAAEVETVDDELDALNVVNWPCPVISPYEPSPVETEVKQSNASLC